MKNTIVIRTTAAIMARTRPASYMRRTSAASRLLLAFASPSETIPAPKHRTKRVGPREHDTRRREATLARKKRALIGKC